MRASLSVALPILWHFLLGSTVPVAATLPLCPQLQLQAFARYREVSPGGRQVVAAKVANTGATTVTGLALRLLLPQGFVPYPKPPKGTVAAVEGNRTAVYFTGLSLGPRKLRRLRVRARACATATPGTYPVGATAYVVNATNGITCMTGLTTVPMVRERVGRLCA